MTICPNCGQMHQARELEVGGSIENTEGTTAVLIMQLPWMPKSANTQEHIERLAEIIKIIRNQYDRKAGAA